MSTSSLEKVRAGLNLMDFSPQVSIARLLSHVFCQSSFLAWGFFASKAMNVPCPLMLVILSLSEILLFSSWRKYSPTVFAFSIRLSS